MKKKIYVVILDRDEPGGIFDPMIVRESQPLSQRVVVPKLIDVPEDLLEGEINPEDLVPEGYAKPPLESTPYHVRIYFEIDLWHW